MSDALIRMMHFKVKGELIYSVDLDEYEDYIDEMMESMCQQHGCTIKDVTTEVVEYDLNSSDIYECDYCGYTDCYTFKNNEERELQAYRNAFPRTRAIQEILPDMPNWMRETYILGSMGCMCPRCSKIEIEPEEYEGEV